MLRAKLLEIRAIDEIWLKLLAEIRPIELIDWLLDLLILAMEFVELEKDLETRPILEIYLVTVFLMAPILEIEAEFWPSTTIFAIEEMDRFRVFWTRPIEVILELLDIEIRPTDET